MDKIKVKKTELSVPKRNLAKELFQGIQEIEKFKAGKITLRTHSVIQKPQPKIDAELIRSIRLKLNLSQSIFALRLRVKIRTLEKWEQGTTTPNDQAVALILMARKYPDTFERLAKI